MPLIDFAHVAKFAGEVTPEQIGKVNPIIEDGRTVYAVENEAGEVDEAGELIEYKVSHHPQMGFFCTCKAGEYGFMHVRHKSGVCKHVRWTVAFVLERRSYYAELAAKKQHQQEQQADEPTKAQAIQRFMREHHIEIDGKPATAEEVERLIFKLSPRPTQEEVKRDQERYQARPFKLM